MHSIDIFVQNYFSLIRTAGLTEFMYLLSALFDFSLPFILVSLCVATLVYIIRNRSYALLFILSLAGGAVLVYFLKIFFNVARPPNTVMSVFGQSFPSGHATVATIFFVMLMYIFDSRFKSFGRIAFNTFCIIAILLVDFSRVYLGVHWVSDVVFGILLGSAISYLSVIIFNRLRLTKDNKFVLQ